MKKSLVFLFAFMTAATVFAQDSGAQEEYDRLSACKAVSAEIEAEAQHRARAMLHGMINDLPETYESLEEELGKLNEKNPSMEEIYAQVAEEYAEELKKFCQ